MSLKYLEAEFEQNQSCEAQPGQELPTYRPEFAAQARKLCQLGATDIELADFFDATNQTILTWRARHEEFSEAIRIGKECADGRIERSLYQRACGYERDAVRIINGPNGLTIVHYREHVPGDVTAQLKWLANRRPDCWSDKANASVEVAPERTAAERSEKLINELSKWRVFARAPDGPNIHAHSTVSRAATRDERSDKNERRGRIETRREPLQGRSVYGPASESRTIRNAS